MAFIIKSNAAQATDVLIKDLGYIILNSGGTVTLTETEEIERARQSEDLRTFLTDNAHTGSSTLEMDEGAGTIDDADVLNWLETFQLPEGDANYGVVQSNGSGQIDQNLTFDGTVTVSSLIAGSDVNLNSNKLTGVASGTASTDGINKGQLDAATIGGKIWKELILDCPNQLLDGASGGIRSATVFWVQELPTAADTWTLAHTTLANETFTFLASESVAFDVAIGATPDDTLTNLAQAINDDSVGWGAVKVTTLQAINDGTGTVTAGHAVIIYELAANNTGDSRMFGSFATGAPEYVNFNGELDYEIETNTALPSADSAQREFGFGRAIADLITNESHVCRTDDTVKTWNDDDQVWENTGSNGIQAGAGLIKTGDVLSVDFGEVGDIADVGTAAAAGVLTEAAAADHVHPHSDLSGVAQTHHDTVQIDEDTAQTNLGTNAGDAQSIVNAAINTALAAGRFVGKILQYSQTEGVKSSGILHLRTGGGLLGSQAGKRMIRAGTISALTINVPDGEGDAANAYKLSVEKSTDGGTVYAEIANLALPTSTESAGTKTPTGSLIYAEGDLIRALVVRTSGTTKSFFTAVDGSVEYVDTAA